jgi:hypothetical protein
MTVDELMEALGLYTRWCKRDTLKLTASERYWIRHRLSELGVVLELTPEPKRYA